MSIPIIDLRQQQKKPTARDLLVSGIGQFGTGLGEVIKEFTQKEAQQKSAQSLAKFLNLDEEQQKAFAGLNPEQQKLAVTALATQQKAQQQTQKEQTFAGALSKVLGFEAPDDTPSQINGEKAPVGSSGLGIQEITKLAEFSQREKLAKGKIAAQRSSKILERADEIRETLPIKESSLKLMKDAIETENLSFFSKDNLAELTGIEGFRTAKGAQFITAGKEFFLGSIRRAGPRPNIFVEQQIAKMMPKLGRSREANETVAASFQADLDVERERLRLTDEIEERFLKRNQNVPGNVGALISKELKPFAQERQDQLAEELKEIQSGQKALILKAKKERPKNSVVIEFEGKVGFVPKEQLETALKKGAKRL